MNPEARQHLIKQPQNRYIETIAPEQLNPELVRKLPLEFLKKHCAIPILVEDNQVAIAFSDPLDVEAYDAIVTILGLPCARIVCPASEIEKAISRCYYQTTVTTGSCQGFAAEDSRAHKTEADEIYVQTQAEDLLNIANKAPVIKLVNKVFFQAVHSRASDIHIEPYENEVRIRFRIDGVLHDVLTLPRQQLAALVSRVKVMASLNIAERRLPQDGQSRIKIGTDLVDIRVSVIPTLGGERVMLRLLNKSTGKLSLSEIGFSPDMLSRYRTLIQSAHGIILLTGPTGSGKTTTLYATINELNCQERNILTVEDPIEYQLPGVGQMQVKPKINLTFANCLRHILRQDPNVIMIGEIRDVETAQIAIQASLTGHLVLSTLHTNDAASAMTRLVDMGIEPYLISSSVIAVMAQRLIRVICPDCRTPCPSDEATVSQLAENGLSAAAGGALFKGAGCKNCLQTGYFGRTAIFELLVMDDSIRDLILARSSSHIIKELAVNNGLSTLRQAGWEKVLAGLTSVEEVVRVTQDSAQEEIEVIERVHN